MRATPLRSICMIKARGMPANPFQGVWFEGCTQASLRKEYKTISADRQGIEIGSRCGEG